ncbi:Abi family protein [Vibrio sp. B513a]|uniref:hypothetical protein n=1 Tax=Vibrio TaxID=662 RepID=UPI001DE49635|nr:hypothetical protein [Vibrio sp. B513a]EHH2560877.1 hypothetical protein [Vibrio parahaemolyticus]EKA7378581.1 Abi family protein [Vibrio parahaemolyticus]MDK9752769.1 Abi family protein [Vibrio sp. B513a]
MINYLSKPRADAVQYFFNTTSDKALLGCYRWCQSTASSLLSSLNDFEICLRNSLHFSLSHYYNTQDWLGVALLNGGIHNYSNVWMNPGPASALLNQAPHSMGSGLKKDIVRAYLSATNKTPDGVIAELSFGFWEKLLQGLNHQSHASNGNGDVLVKTLEKAFPCYEVAITASSTPPVYGPWDLALRDRLIRLIKQIRGVRNRIGHHDSIRQIPEFDEHGVKGYVPRKPRHTINSLTLLLQRLVMIASWIEPSLLKKVTATDYWHKLDNLLSKDALGVYRYNGGAGDCYLKSIEYKKVMRKNKYKDSKYKKMNVRKPDEFLFIKKMYF